MTKESSGTRRLGELLVERELISAADLQRALALQVGAGGRLGTVLIEQRLVDIDQVGRTLGEQKRVPVASQTDLERASAEAVAAVSAELAEKHTAVPFLLDDGRIHIALRDPLDVAAQLELGFVTGAQVVPHVAPELRIYYQLERLYRVARTPRYLRIPHQACAPPQTERRRHLQPLPAFVQRTDEAAPPPRNLT